jgi:hypothetical protein
MHRAKPQRKASLQKHRKTQDGSIQNGNRMKIRRMEIVRREAGRTKRTGWKHSE